MRQEMGRNQNRQLNLGQLGNWFQDGKRSDIALHRLAQHLQHRHIDGIVLVVRVRWIRVFVLIAVIKMVGEEQSQVNVRHLFLSAWSGACRDVAQALKENGRHQQARNCAFQHNVSFINAHSKSNSIAECVNVITDYVLVAKIRPGKTEC